MRRTTLLLLLPIVVGVLVLIRVMSMDPGDPPPAKPIAANPAPEADEPDLPVDSPPPQRPPKDGLSNDGMEPVRWEEDVRIRVISREDETPVEGALVRVSLPFEDHDGVREATTDADGEATIPSPRGRADWLVRRAGFRPHQGSRDFDDGAVIRLDPAPSLSGRVVRAGSGDPIVDARVRLWPEGESYRELDIELTTDADGHFEAAGIPDDLAIQIGISAAGLGSVIRRMTPDDRIGPVEVRLGEGALIGGTVHDDAGDPVAEAEVYVVLSGGDDPFRPAEYDVDRGLTGDQVEALRVRTTTDADGRYRVEGLEAPKEYVACARAPDGRVGRSEPFHLAVPGEDMKVDVVVRGMGEIHLRFLDGEDGPVVPTRDLRVTLDGKWGDAPDHRKARWHAKSRTERFKLVEPGRHTVVVDPDGFVAVHMKLDLLPGEVLERTVILERGLTIKGRLVDTNGEPVAGMVWFQAVVEGVEHSPSTHSRADGSFTLHGLPTARGELTGWAQDYQSTELEGVMPGGDVGAIVLSGSPRIVGKLPAGIRAGRRVGCGVWYEDGGGRTGSVGIGADGSFAYTELLPGRRLNFFLRMPGRPAFIARDLVLEAGATHDLGAVHFPDPVTLTGAALDPDGKPIPFARIRIAEFWFEETATADGRGRFSLAGLPPGRCHVIVEREGTPVAYCEVVVTAGAAPVELRAKAQGTIRASVRDTEGNAVGIFPFNLLPLDAEGEPDWTRRSIVWTDGRGHMELPTLEGRFILEPHPNRGRALAAPCPPITVTRNNVTELELVLE